MKVKGEPKPRLAFDNADPCGPLGLYPATAVAVLVDLGMTDQEIAGYFHVSPDDIVLIRQNSVPELRLVCDGKRIDPNQGSRLTKLGKLFGLGKARALWVRRQND